MRTVYCEKFGRAVAATDDRYVLSDRVRSGNILYVMSCFACAPEREVNDIVRLGIISGGEYVCLRMRAGALAKQGMSALSPFLVGEGDQVYAYFPDSDTGDEICLCLNGFIIPVSMWREAPY